MISSIRETRFYTGPVYVYAYHKRLIMIIVLKVQFFNRRATFACLLVLDWTDSFGRYSVEIRVLPKHFGLRIKTFTRSICLFILGDLSHLINRRKPTKLKQHGLTHTESKYFVGLRQMFLGDEVASFFIICGDNWVSPKRSNKVSIVVYRFRYDFNYEEKYNCTMGKVDECYLSWVYTWG